MNPLFKDQLKSLVSKFDKIKKEKDIYGISLDTIQELRTSIQQVVDLAKQNEIKRASDLYTDVNSKIDNIMGVSDIDTADNVPNVRPNNQPSSNVHKTKKPSVKSKNPKPEVQKQPNNNTSPHISLSDKISAIRRFHPNKDKIRPIIDEYEMEMAVSPTERDSDKLKKLTTKLNFFYNGIPDKHKISSSTQSTTDQEKTQKIINDISSQVTNQIPRVEDEIKTLEDKRGKEVADEKRKELEDAISEFDEVKNNNFTSSDEAYKTLSKPSNKINLLLATIDKLIKHGKVYSPEEMSQRSRDNKQSGIDKEVRKRFRTVAKNIDAEEKTKKDAEKLAKKLGFDLPQSNQEPEDTPEEPNIEPEPDKTLPNSQIIQNKLDTLDAAIQDGEELQQDMVDYAKNLASNMQSSDDETEALNALDAALEGDISLQSYLDSKSTVDTLAESHKRAKRKILEAFEF